jgi:hypothetical protein
VNQSDDRPQSIVFKRHRDLAGREFEPWLRRAGLALLSALVLAALLNAFGQHPTTSSASAPAASLHVEAPNDVRGGLLFQARFTIHAFREVRTPKLVLDAGWYESFTVNTTTPEPKEVVSDNGRNVLSYDAIPAGRQLIVWVEFQVNPTNIGRHEQDVELWDGESRILHLDHSTRVLP